MVSNMNAPMNRWKYMTAGDHRKSFLRIRPEDNVVSNQTIIKITKKNIHVLNL